MTDSPDREFEIVLGNKQLFSLLFIVFVLLGVFFAMGYLMGRNTLPVDTAANGGKTTGTSSAALDAPVSSTRPSATGPAPAVETPSAASPSAAATPEPAAPERTAPAPEKTRAAAPAVEPPPPAALTVVEPKPGQTFLQVSAITRAEAELLVEVLQKKGFRALLAPGPGNLFRVLVGPMRDDADMAKTRTALEQSGFHPLPRRY